MLEGLRRDIGQMEKFVELNPRHALNNGGRYLLAGALVAPYALISMSGTVNKAGGLVIGGGLFFYGFIKLRSRVREWSQK